MSDILFTINAVFPIILLVLLGYFLKKIGLVTKQLAAGINKLVFKIFLPVTLFLNIYTIKSASDIDIGYVLYASAATVLIFIISLPLVCRLTKDPSKRGPTLQGTFRSNYAIVGIPLAISLCGIEGGMVASVLSAVLVPLYNSLAVVSLSIFSKDEKKIDVKKIIIGIIKNPLIDAIALGGVFLLIRFAFSKLSISFRLSDIAFLYETLEMLSSVSTPLALIALGTQFELSAISALKKPIIFITLLRGALIPLLGLGAAYLMNCFTAAHFASFIAVFVSPVSISSVPMAQEMGGDHALAGQFVVWTTVCSAFSLFASIYVLRLLGVF